jgi:predicted house-cleaning noncanonical NTP pyrophosphatase (MazG superfamily)
MKLIRDGYVNMIPEERLDTSSKDYETKLELILEKIKEEIIEYLKTKGRNPEELGDIMEAVIGLGELHGFDFGIINAQRKDKHRKYGGFKNFVVLKDVNPNLKYSLSSETEEHF